MIGSRLLLHGSDLREELTTDRTPSHQRLNLVLFFRNYSIYFRPSCPAALLKRHGGLSPTVKFSSSTWLRKCHIWLYNPALLDLYQSNAISLRRPCLKHVLIPVLCTNLPFQPLQPSSHLLLQIVVHDLYACFLILLYVSLPQISLIRH